MDAATIERARSGDRAAQAAVIEHVNPSIEQALTRLRVFGADRDDATQVARMRVLEVLHRFEGRSTLASWAFAITRNIVINGIRSARRRYEVVCDIVDEVVVGQAPCAESLFNDAETVKRVRGAMDLLSPEMAIAFERFYVDDAAIDDIAREIGVLPATVRTRMYRSRATMRTRLEEVSP